jgi:error-prone DNA polymerase
VEASGPFRSPEALHYAACTPAKALRRVAAADAMASMGLDRQQALWRVRSLRDDDLPLFEHLIEEARPKPDLPAVLLERQMVQDYATTSLSLKAHPLEFLRERLDAAGAAPAGVLRDETAAPRGRPITVAGLVLSRQRPSTAKGIVFISIEDETGVANLIVRPDVFERDRKAARHATTVLVSGLVERKGRVVHVMAKSIRSLDDHVADTLLRSRDFR